LLSEQQAAQTSNFIHKD